MPTRSSGRSGRTSRSSRTRTTRNTNTTRSTDNTRTTSAAETRSTAARSTYTPPARETRQTTTTPPATRIIDTEQTPERDATPPAELEAQEINRQREEEIRETLDSRDEATLEREDLVRDVSNRGVQETVTAREVTLVARDVSSATQVELVITGVESGAVRRVTINVEPGPSRLNREINGSRPPFTRNTRRTPARDDFTTRRTATTRTPGDTTTRRTATTRTPGDTTRRSGNTRTTRR